ncbi:MAG: hypothetical protein Q9207_005518 [Kuettlingeria erythrocarpa]
MNPIVLRWRTRSLYEFKIREDTLALTPDLTATQLCYNLAGDNRSLPYRAFSRSQLVSVYDVMVRKYFAKEDRADSTRSRSKEAIAKFKANLDLGEIYAVLQILLVDVPDFLEFRYKTGDPMTSAEIVQWVSGRTCASSPSRSIQFGAAEFSSESEPELSQELVDDLVSLSEEIKEEFHSVAQAHDKSVAIEGRTLLVSLHDDPFHRCYRSDAPTNLYPYQSHFHVDYPTPDGKLCVSRAVEMMHDPDSATPAIALEFTDCATKELALVALSRVKWATTTTPFASPKVADYPRKGNEEQAQNVLWHLQITREMRLDDLCNLILHHLPRPNYRPAYEISPFVKGLNTAQGTRMRIRRCPQWIRRFVAGGKEARGPFYISAFPVQGCGYCQRLDRKLPALEDTVFKFEYHKGIEASLPVSAYPTEMILDGAPSEHDPVLHAVHRIAHRSLDSTSYNSFHGDSVGLSPVYNFTQYLHHIKLNYKNASTDDKVAAFRRLGGIQLYSHGLLHDRVAGSMTQQLYKEEEENEPALDDTHWTQRTILEDLPLQNGAESEADNAKAGLDTCTASAKSILMRSYT